MHPEMQVLTLNRVGRLHYLVDLKISSIIVLRCVPGGFVSTTFEHLPPSPDCPLELYTLPFVSLPIDSHVYS